ncbi:MAG: DedA family protein [Acidobacteriota bacterium]|jgi:membrane-associated protein
MTLSALPCLAVNLLVFHNPASPPEFSHFFVQKGMWGIYLLIALAAFIKYVIPPLPGDLGLLVGIFYLGIKHGSWPVAILAVMIGGTLGAYLAYLGGGQFGSYFKNSRKLSAVVDRAKTIVSRWGVWALVANRFIPYIRIFLFPAAGMMRMRRRDVAISGLVGNFLFACVMVALGYSSGRKYHKLVALYSLYQGWVIFLAVLAFVILVTWFAGSRTLKPRLKSHKH